ncbi:MAG: hypothetical protein MI741_20185, partial [Rhodospirillales bacterium]|nr:hypothetical protein [Rhodospirillales bacterium]
MSKRSAWVLLFCFAACCTCRVTLAAGGTVHVLMTEKAIEHVSDPQLKKIIERHRDVLLWAGWFPDSGYPGGNT